MQPIHDCLLLVAISRCLPFIQQDNAEILEFALLINLKHLTIIKEATLQYQNEKPEYYNSSKPHYNIKIENLSIIFEVNHITILK